MKFRILNKYSLIVKFLVLINVVFFIYYFLLAVYSRYHYDDLHFLWQLREMSIFEYIKDMYFSRSGRFVAYFINGIVFKTILFTGQHFYYSIIFWFIGVFATWYVIKSIVKDISSFLLFNAVVFFYNVYVLTNIDFPVFYWLCAMSYYLFPPLTLLFIYLVNKEKISLINKLTLLALSVFFGGGHEAYTFIFLYFLLLYVVCLFYNYSFNIKLTLKDIRIKRIMFFLLIILCCFIVVVIAPGNYMRMSAQEFKHPDSLFNAIKALCKAIMMFYYYLAFYIPYYFILLGLFMYIGYVSKIKLFINNFSLKKSLIILLFAYFIYMLLSVVPNVYLWDGFGIQRNYTHVVFFTLLFIIFLGYLLGNKLRDKIQVEKLKLLLLIVLPCFFVIMLINLYYDVNSAKSYAQSTDNRINYLLKINKSKQTSKVVTVERVAIPYTCDTKFLLYKVLKKKSNPHPLLYYISDTDTIPDEYAYQLKKNYGLTFLVKLQK